MNTNNFDNIIQELINLGFNKYEANAYVALLRNPSSTRLSKIELIVQYFLQSFFLRCG